jgi:hypothetical protein
MSLLPLCLWGEVRDIHGPFLISHGALGGVRAHFVLPGGSAVVLV